MPAPIEYTTRDYASPSITLSLPEDVMITFLGTIHQRKIVMPVQIDNIFLIRMATAEVVS